MGFWAWTRGPWPWPRGSCLPRPAGKTRLDQRLLELGLAKTRSEAQAAIMAGLVRVDGQPASKAGMPVKAEAEVTLSGAARPYVSRGGEKLAGALDALGVDVAGLICLDVGASTGGFTDCLLQRGAARVVALDVGYGQLAWELRTDDRVEVIERTNARNMGPEVAPGPFGFITADVSFISLTLVLPALAARLKPGGLLLCLVKPQFEAGPEQVGKGGVVRDDAVRAACADKVADFMTGLSLSVLGQVDSALPGPAGNREIFMLARAPESPGGGETRRQDHGGQAEQEEG